MILSLIVTPEAEADLAEAQEWYERKRKGLGREFIRRVNDVIEQVRRVPRAAAILPNGVRRAVVRGFPYCVYYQVDREQLAVLAVYHTSRNPGGWEERT